MTEEFGYLDQRLKTQQEWHSDKASLNKKRYYSAEIVTLAAGALIPVINVLAAIPDSWVRLLSASLAAVAVISAGIGKLCKFQENWLSFRAVAEALKREEELYQHQVGDYGSENKRRTQLLVERIENILASTTAQFISIHKAEEEKPADQ